MPKKRAMEVLKYSEHSFAQEDYLGEKLNVKKKKNSTQMSERRFCIFIHRVEFSSFQ